jgi:hypothetical protein
MVFDTKKPRSWVRGYRLVSGAGDRMVLGATAYQGAADRLEKVRHHQRSPPAMFVKDSFMAAIT